MWLSAPELADLKINEVHVWQAFLDVDEATVQEFECILSADEKERASRFHFDRDRNRFVACRATLRKLLSRYLRTEADRIEFSYGEEGKPSPANESVDVRFNLSHSESMALFGFTRGREIGIDVEKIRPGVASEGLCQIVFSSGELHALRSLPIDQQNDFFFLIWTRKEAYVKALGKGVSFPLKDITVIPGAPAALINRANNRDEASRWLIAEIAVGAAYAAALAVEGREWTLRCWRLYPNNEITSF